MNMKRHYFTSDSLDELERFEQALETAGVPAAQIHVLSLDDTGVHNHHHLHEVQDFMKRDIVHSTEVGALMGVVAAGLVLGVAYLTGATQSVVGWTPFVFLAIVLLGFFTWEGGLLGIQTLNRQFERFERELNNGRHVFFVDVAPDEEPVLRRELASFQGIQAAGTGRARPRWMVVWQERVRHFFVDVMP